MTGRGLPGRQLVLVLICGLGLLPLPRAEGAGLAPAPGSRDLALLNEAVNEIQALIFAADFQAAIAQAETARNAARDLPRGPEPLQMKARLEVLVSTAQIALGDRTAARSSIKRAVYMWPLLNLDERTTSPRVMKLFRAVRRDGKKTARRSR
jgi:hypothetical protein